MPVCVPIKDLRDTAKFSELVETAPMPVTVTKNGYSKFVVMRVDDYDAMARAQAEAHLMERLAVMEKERTEHAGRDAWEALADLEEKYGI